MLGTDFMFTLNLNIYLKIGAEIGIINEINKLGFPAFTGSCGEIYNENCLKDFKNKKI